jgi:hypothetical protein
MFHKDWVQVLWEQLPDLALSQIEQKKQHLRSCNFWIWACQLTYCMEFSADRELSIFQLTFLLSTSDLVSHSLLFTMLTTDASIMSIQYSKEWYMVRWWQGSWVHCHQFNEQVGGRRNHGWTRRSSRSTKRHASVSESFMKNSTVSLFLSCELNIFNFALCKEADSWIQYLGMSWFQEDCSHPHG